MINTVTDNGCQDMLSAAAHVDALGGMMQMPNAKKEVYESPMIKLIKMEPITLMDYTGANIISKGDFEGETGRDGYTDLGGDDSGSTWGGWE